jgi:hypothetical protein
MTTNFGTIEIAALDAVTGGYHDPAPSAPSAPSAPACNPRVPGPIGDRGLGDIFRRLIQRGGIGGPLRWPDTAPVASRE